MNRTYLWSKKKLNSTVFVRYYSNECSYHKIIEYRRYNEFKLCSFFSLFSLSNFLSFAIKFVKKKLSHRHSSTLTILYNVVWETRAFHPLQSKQNYNSWSYLLVLTKFIYLHNFVFDFLFLSLLSILNLKKWNIRWLIWRMVWKNLSRKITMPMMVSKDIQVNFYFSI